MHSVFAHLTWGQVWIHEANQLDIGAALINFVNTGNEVQNHEL